MGQVGSDTCRSFIAICQLVVLGAVTAVPKWTILDSVLAVGVPATPHHMMLSILNNLVNSADHGRCFARSSTS